MDKIFPNFSITHGYSSTLSMNSFNSALLYDDFLYLGYPSFIDTISNSFVPYFLVPNLLISEQFGPLVGIDFSTVSQFSGRFEYRKSRQLSLSLLDYQLAEVRSSEIVLNARYRMRGKLPFTINIGKKKEGAGKVDSDITFALDFSIRDDFNSNSRLHQTNAFATGGQKVITIRPTIEYVLSNRINLQFYFEISRLLRFFSQASEASSRKELKARMKEMQNDLLWLRQHVDSEASKVNFLLDATLGLINIEQNAIIKIFSVAPVVFLPPTLVASVYGMNFEFMPELQSPFGYPLALLLMVTSAVLSYVYFKRKGWL